MDEKAALAHLSGDFRRIAELVGVENAFRISREFGGLIVFVPKLDHLQRLVRDAEIRNAYDRKTSVRDLARRYKLTMRQVYTILGKESHDLPSEDLPLFLPGEDPHEK
jgi:Mor family transcriptional regulator